MSSNHNLLNRRRFMSTHSAETHCDNKKSVKLSILVTKHCVRRSKSPGTHTVRFPAVVSVLLTLAFTGTSIAQIKTVTYPIDPSDKTAIIEKSQPVPALR